MVFVSELPNLEHVERAKLLLFLADPAFLSKDASHASKRKYQLLVLSAVKGQQLPSLDATEEHVHRLFVRRYKAALRLVAEYERFPVPFYLTTLQTAPTPLTDTSRNRLESLTERVAIMLDSCAPVQLTDLTTTFGKDALGGYAHEFGQPLSRQDRPFTSF